MESRPRGQPPRLLSPRSQLLSAVFVSPNAGVCLSEETKTLVVSWSFRRDKYSLIYCRVFVWRAGYDTVTVL